MSRRAGLLAGVGLAVAVAVISVAPASGAIAAPGHKRAQAAPLPTSIASLGDSITEAFDATPTRHILSDQPQYSWSTGYSPAVDSQYERLVLAGDRAVKGRHFDDASSGAKMFQLRAQAERAVAQRAAYVTILMGANDLCTRTAAAMTPVAAFRRELDQALSVLAARPGARVFVSSIPNLYRLWQVLHHNPIAESRWALGICPSMLSAHNSQGDRLAVVARERAYNSALASVCESFENCRFDHMAVFDYPFRASQVSTIDDFHPSIAGENELASLTWRASYWARLR
ncbi:MAG: GDSL-type esterase/lipase family protein [Acidimicrobiales bacterium]